MVRGAGRSEPRLSFALGTLLRLEYRGGRRADLPALVVAQSAKHCLVSEADLDVLLRECRTLRVLITGVAGFIGGHLAARLVTDGHAVIGIDNLSAGVLENVHPRVTFHCADIRSRGMYPFFDGIDAVFHLAAKNCLPDCMKDPVETAGINVVGTANVLEATRLARVPKLVYADTSAEYEGVPELPSQVGRIAPLSIYARSKCAGAMFCEAYASFYGLRFTTVRYFNVYGPAQDWRRSVPPLMSAFGIKMLRG